MNSSRKDLMEKINSTGDYDDDIEAALKAAIEEFKKDHTW
jgi:F-type H+-transporting ATPase subunit alpha